MKLHEKYFVVFKDGKQLGYYKLEDLPKTFEEDVLLKEVRFNPQNTTCSLDSNNNVILNISKPTPPEVENTEIQDVKKNLQYMLAFLIKNKIFSYAVAVDDGKISPEKFYETIESSLDFKIDNTYAELETLIEG